MAGIDVVADGVRGLWAARVALALWTLAVLWSSLARVASVPGATLVSDKVLHAFAYGLLGALALASTRRSRPASVFVVVVGFGLLLELLQLRTGYRSFEWSDLLADAVGAATGITVVLVLRHFRGRRA